ncbi:TPA: hypothetical protein ACGXP7_006123 [Bacillus cereus]
MTQRLDIFYRDECNEEAINTSIIADECRISVPRQIKLKIDFQFDSQTVDTPYVSIVDIDDDKVVYNKTLSRNRVDQAFLPASNKNKKYLFTIKNMFGYTYRFKCKENSRNAYEMRFDDNYRGEDYNDVIANLKFIPNPINDKGIVFLRHRKGTFINTAHGTGPSVQMIGEANYNPSISDEAWIVERSEGIGPLMHGDGVFLLTRSQYYLNTDHGVGPKVKVRPDANRDTHISDEVWIIERPSGNGPVNYGDAVFIKTRKNYYLNSDGKVDSSVFVLPESNTVICHSDEIWFLE